MKKRWKIGQVDERDVRELQAELGLPAPLCRLLLVRGISAPEEAATFLSCDIEDLHDPFLMKDMDKAVARLQNAIRSREPILIYGDFDADGICATALLYETLDAHGADVSYHLPDRLDEGYGLSADRVRWAQESGARLIVCVDNGVTAHEEIALANELGMDVIVADHHEPSGNLLPPAVAVLDPKREDATYPFRYLAGVGVTSKLCQALTNEIGGLDLVAFGTIADIVPLLDENRILVRAGLEEMNMRKRTGIAQLISVSGRDDATLRAHNVAFQLAPRINAAGRLGAAAVGIEILLTNSSGDAWEMARRLDEENRTRRSIEQEIVDQAVEMLDDSFAPSQRIIVLSDDRWHPGVIGIASSRIVRQYYRPTVLIAVSDGIGKGSARSIGAFDMHAALASCEELLEGFGGHRLAAGFTIRTDRIDELRERLIQRAAEELSEDTLVPELKIDAVVMLGDVDRELVGQLDKLRPFGTQNPQPVFVSQGVELVGNVTVLRGNHIRFRVRQDGAVHGVIGFGMADLRDDLSGGARFDIAFKPRINRWRGRDELELTLEDMRVNA